MSLMDALNEAIADYRPTPAVGPAPSVLAGTVFVALATFTKTVVVRDTAVSEPLSGGRMGIFNRQTVQEAQLGAEVVGVYGTEAEAQRAVEAHRAAYPGLNAEYTVSSHTVGAKVADKPAAAVTESRCIGEGCGQRTPNGQSFCQRCREKQWANSGWRPESRDEE